MTDPNDDRLATNVDAPPPAVRKWAHVLIAALDAHEHVQWEPPGSRHSPKNAMVVYLEDDRKGACALHLGKRCAAAIVTRLLRRGGALHRTSSPEQVRQAVIEYLAEAATEAPSASSQTAKARASFNPPARTWASPWTLTLCTNEEEGLQVAVSIANSPAMNALEATQTHFPRTRENLPPSLTELHLELPLLVAASHAPRAELSSWAPGDLWLPDTGWLATPDVLLDAQATSPRPTVEAWLALPGADRCARVLLRGSKLTWCGDMTSARRWSTPPPAGHAEWADVRVSAGRAQLSLHQWSSLLPSSELTWHPAPLWELYVDGSLGALGTPKPWHGTWGVELSHVLGKFAPLGAR